MVELRFVAICFSVATAIVVMPQSARAQAFGSKIAAEPESRCATGYIWRQADTADHVCVTPAQREQVVAENAVPGLQSASGTCITGYVWREADATDHVCVTPSQRAQAAAQNRVAATHVLASAASVPGTLGKSVVSRASLSSSTAPRTLGSLTLAQRLRLDPRTVVRLPSGRVTTMSVLLREHQNRMARINRLRIPIVHYRPTGRRPLGSSFARLGDPRFTFGLNNGLVSASGPQGANSNSAASPAGTLVPAVLGPSSVYAADYLYFCTQAQASICLYYPAGVQLGSEGWGQNGIAGPVSDVDYLVPQNICQQEGGLYETTVQEGNYCIYNYPGTATVSYFPGVPASASVIGQCPTQLGFSGTFDPHGVVVMNFVPVAASGGTGGSNYMFTLTTPTTCVLQIYAPGNGAAAQ
jgi:hypothetical protein